MEWSSRVIAWLWCSLNCNDCFWGQTHLTVKQMMYSLSKTRGKASKMKKTRNGRVWIKSWVCSEGWVAFSAPSATGALCSTFPCGRLHCTDNRILHGLPEHGCEKSEPPLKSVLPTEPKSVENFLTNTVILLLNWKFKIILWKELRCSYFRPDWKKMKATSNWLNQTTINIHSKV